MQLKITIKPYAVKETHYSDISCAISDVMAHYGCRTIGTYGIGYCDPFSDTFFVYSLETFKRGKYRSHHKQIFRIFKFSKAFLETTKQEVVQHPRYFRLIPLRK